MAARLATLHGSDTEIRRLREMFGEFAEGQVQARIDEYSETNVRFHQAILRMGRSQVLDRLADNLLLHMRSIRKHTIGRARSRRALIIDHMHIIEASRRATPIAPSASSASTASTSPRTSRPTWTAGLIGRRRRRKTRNPQSR